MVSKNHEKEKWSYVSGQGLIPFPISIEMGLAHPSHCRDHIKMKPVDRLSSKEMNDLLTYAKRYKKTLDEPVLGSDKIKGVIQFVTHPKTTFKHPILQNANAQMNVHCGIRLIMPNGDIYSFGFGGDFQEHLLKKDPTHCVASINGQPKNFDYMEFQKFEQRIETTIPLDEAQAETLLNQLNIYREHGVRFNVLKQNCVRFGTHLLHLVNIDVNTRVSLLTTFWRGLPNIEHLPIIGTPLGSLKKISQRVYQTVDARIPSIVKQIFAQLSFLALYLPHKLATILINLGLIAIGGKMASFNSSLDPEKSSKLGQLENFDTLVSSVFDDQSTDVYHSSIFINWQLNQENN